MCLESVESGWSWPNSPTATQLARPVPATTARSQVQAGAGRCRHVPTGASRCGYRVTQSLIEPASLLENATIHGRAFSVMSAQ